MVTMNDARQTYFVGRHPEGVNITLFRGFSPSEQFRGNVADKITLHPSFDPGIKISYDTCDPEVPQAWISIIVDQDVSLERVNISACLKRRTCSELTGWTLPCTISSECR